jgi:hypothetical protein
LEVDVQLGNFKILRLLPQVLIFFLVEKWIPPSRQKLDKFVKKIEGILGVKCLFLKVAIPPQPATLPSSNEHGAFNYRNTIASLPKNNNNLVCFWFATYYINFDCDPWNSPSDIKMFVFGCYVATILFILFHVSVGEDGGVV